MSQVPTLARPPATPSRKRKGQKNPDNLIRYGYDPPTTPEDIQIQFQKRPSSRGQQEWCTLFNLTSREFNLWRRGLRVHLRKPSGHVGEEDATNQRGLYAVGGQEWAWWQLTTASTNTFVFVMAGSLLFDILEDEQFKSYFAQAITPPSRDPSTAAPQCNALRSTTWTWSYADDVTLSGTKVKRIVPGFPLKLEILKQWITWESKEMQQYPKLRDRFTETEVLPYSAINPAYFDHELAPKPRKSPKKGASAKLKLLNSVLFVSPNDDDPNTWLAIQLAEILNDPNKFSSNDLELDDVRYRKLRDRVDSSLGNGSIFYADEEGEEQNIDNTAALMEALSVLQARRIEDPDEKLKLGYER